MKIIRKPNKKEIDDMKDISSIVDMQIFVQDNDCGESIVLRVYVKKDYDGVGINLGTDLSCIVLKSLRRLGALNVFDGEKGLNKKEEEEGLVDITDKVNLQSFVENKDSVIVIVSRGMDYSEGFEIGKEMSGVLLNELVKLNLLNKAYRSND